jgi:LacI family transcriptional regulator
MDEAPDAGKSPKPERARATLGRARLSDVAQRAGVSTATVSRTFNEPEKVSPEVRDQVLKAARSLAWIPNAAGRALASSRSYIAGVVIPTLDDEIFASLVSGMQAGLAEQGMTLFIGCSNYDPEEGLRQVKAMLTRGVEALAVVGEAHPPELFEALRARVPYVVTYGWRRGGPHPMIGFDNFAAYERLTGHLLDLGHRRFGAVFQSSRNNDRVTDRIAGMRTMLERHGITLDPDCLHEGERSVETGRLGLRALLAARSGPPTAVVCGNDQLAIGVLLEAEALGLRVPEDLSVTGFDDIALARQLRPSLTSMRVDTHRIGRAAADYLLARIQGNDGVELCEIEPTFYPRASTAAAKSGRHQSTRPSG